MRDNNDRIPFRPGSQPRAEFPSEIAYLQAQHFVTLIFRERKKERERSGERKKSKRDAASLAECLIILRILININLVRKN